MTTSYIQNSTAPLDVKAAMEQILTVATSSTTAAAVQTDLDATEATIITDLTALRTAIVYILGAMDTLATKLNADAGVTDTNYVTTNASGHTPAALTTA